MTTPQPELPPAQIQARGVAGRLRRWSAKGRHALWSGVGFLFLLAAVYGPRAAVQGCRGPGAAEQGRQTRQAAYDRAVKPYKERCPRNADMCLETDVQQLQRPMLTRSFYDESLMRHEQTMGQRLAADHPRFAGVVYGFRFSRTRMISFLATVDEVAELIAEFQVPPPSSSLLTGLRRDAQVTVYLRGTPDLADLAEPGERPITIAFIDPGPVGMYALARR